MALIYEKTISDKKFSKKCVFDRHPKESQKRSRSKEVKRGQKRSREVKFPTKLLIFSRKYPVAEKLEQLEQNRKKYLEAHLTGYQRLPICFDL